MRTSSVAHRGAWSAAIVLGPSCSPARCSRARSLAKGTSTNNPESLQGYAAISQHFPQSDAPTELVVVRSETLTCDRPGLRGSGAGARQAGCPVDRAGDALLRLARSGRLFRGTGTRSSSRSGWRGDWSPSARKLIELVRAENGRGGFEVAITGTKVTDEAFNQVSQSDLEKGELRYGLPAALSCWCSSSARSSRRGCRCCLRRLDSRRARPDGDRREQFELSVFVVNMLVGMGLALGIDYALFVVSRFREERAAGSPEGGGDRSRRRDREPRGPLQRQRLRARDAGPASRRAHGHAQPRDRARSSSGSSRSSPR